MGLQEWQHKCSSMPGSHGMEVYGQHKLAAASCIVVCSPASGKEQFERCKLTGIRMI